MKDVGERTTLTEAAIEFQRQTFIDAVREQRADYNTKLEALTKSVELLARAMLQKVGRGEDVPPAHHSEQDDDGQAAAS